MGAVAGAGATFAWLVPDLLRSSEDSIARHLASEGYARYRYGSYPGAKRALLLHAQLAASLGSASDGGRAHRLVGEAGLSYARVAVAAERAKLTDERDLYFKLAREQYGKRGEHPSEAQLRELVAALDLEWDKELTSEHQ